jgi:hypothetical protein
MTQYWRVLGDFGRYSANLNDTILANLADFNERMLMGFGRYSVNLKNIILADFRRF